MLGNVRVHLVDGTYELFRAHYSRRPPHFAPDGSDRKATVGVVATLISLLNDDAEAVTHLAVAFDNPIRSFRNALFQGYKSDAGVDPALRNQFDEVETAVSSLGIVVWSMRDLEADDALATAAHHLSAEFDQVRILTPDKDLGQCIRGQRVVQVDRRTGATLDERGFRERYGFGPESLPDYLALVGDTADGIPGVEGFGAKTASAVLAVHGHLEGIPSSEREWSVPVRGAARLAAALSEERAQALLYRKLATLVLDAPIDATPRALRFEGVPRRRFRTWCDSMAIGSLRDAPRRWAQDEGE